MSQIECRIDITRDSHNSTPAGALILRHWGSDQVEVQFSDGDREVWVDARELLRAVKILAPAPENRP